MNGFAVEATMSSAVGDSWGISCLPGILGFYVREANAVRLVANAIGTAYTGTTSAPAYSVTTGGNLTVRIVVDVDRPAAADGCTVDYYVNGALAGSIVVTRDLTSSWSDTTGPYKVPMFHPIYHAGKVTLACAETITGHRLASFVLYRYTGTTVSGEAVTGWDNDAASVAGTWPYNTGGAYDVRYTAPFGMRPPSGGQLARLHSGAEMIARPDIDPRLVTITDLGARSGLWRRANPDAAWQLVSQLYAGANWIYASPAFGYTGVGTTGNHLHGAEPPRLFLDGEKMSIDDFDTDAAPDLPRRRYLFEPIDGDGVTTPDYRACGLAPTAIATDPGDRSGLAVKYDFRNGRERVYVVPSAPARTQNVANQTTSPDSSGMDVPCHAAYTVADHVRTSGNDASRPWPWVWRRGDGRWVVGWFCNDVPAEYVSDDAAGESWSAASPSADWTAGAGNLAVTNHWPGRDGTEVVAGYHPGDGAFYAFVRGGQDEPWRGPVTIASSSTAAAPYIYERPDGQWEVGWLIGGTWTRYTALTPSGTWSAV